MGACGLRQGRVCELHGAYWATGTHDRRTRQGFDRPKGGFAHITDSAHNGAMIGPDAPATEAGGSSRRPVA